MTEPRTERDELLSLIEDLARENSGEIIKDGKRYLITMGMSTLEEAFAVLGWDDPHELGEVT